MQPSELLHKAFMKKITTIHKTRLNNIMMSVEALIRSKKLTLTALGRHMQSDTKIRSDIRKVDRLLGNKQLHKEVDLFYKQMNSFIVSAKSKPWIHVDWSCLSSRNKLYVLRASLSVKGRSIVVYEETHPKSGENNHRVHKTFLENLQAVLPKEVKPIIVTDAGFRAEWFACIEKMGWDYLGRVRNKNLIKLGKEEEWKRTNTLYALATQTPKYLGEGLLTKRKALRSRVIVYKEKSKKRSKLNQNKTRSRASKSQRYAKAHKEPWLLVTSLKKTRTLAKKVVAIYRERMQIEENFRDTKDRRYGFGLNESNTKTAARMRVLLLVAAIATLICWIAGIFVRKKGYAADYQAHSAKFTSALSIVYLGCEVLRKPLHMTKKSFYWAIECIPINTNSVTGECL